MFRILGLIFLISTLFVTSCRKDTLQWKSIEKLQSHTTSRLNRIMFLPNGLGVISGGKKFESSEFLISADYGTTWKHYSITEAGKGLYGLGYAPDGTIYATGFDGKLVSGTGNGNWKFTQINNWQYYIDIAFPQNNRGIVISTVTTAEGGVYIIDTAGNILSEQLFTFGLNDLEMADSTTGYLAGYGTILKTTDRGSSWHILDIENDNFMAVHAYGNKEAWACGYFGSIFHTTDGGNTWQRKRNGNDLTKPHYRLSDIIFTDAHNGYAVGEKGLLIYTDDGGTHWMEFDRFTDAALRAITVQKDGKLLVCGDNGSLYRLDPAHLR